MLLLDNSISRWTASPCTAEYLERKLTPKAQSTLYERYTVWWGELGFCSRPQYKNSSTVLANPRNTTTVSPLFFCLLTSRTSNFSFQNITVQKNTFLDLGPFRTITWTSIPQNPPRPHNSPSHSTKKVVSNTSIGWINFFPFKKKEVIIYDLWTLNA